MSRKIPLSHKIVQSLVYLILVLIFLLFCSGMINSCSINNKITDVLATCSDCINNRTMGETKSPQSPESVSTSMLDIKRHMIEEMREFVSECHFLMDNSTITFLVTLIIALLATLLLNRIEKMENLVMHNWELVNKNEEIKCETSEFIIHSINYNIFLVHTESIYNISIMIDNLTDIICGQDKTNLSIVGVLCSRIAINVDKLDEMIDSNKIKSFARNEGDILFSYIDDTLGLLRRSISTIKERNKRADREILIYKIIEERHLDIEVLKSRLTILCCA